MSVDTPPPCIGTSKLVNFDLIEDTAGWSSMRACSRSGLMQADVECTGSHGAALTPCIGRVSSRLGQQPAALPEACG
jgi:hypothetical protein